LIALSLPVRKTKDSFEKILSLEKVI